MSRKQEIYCELLRLCLPSLRNCLSHYCRSRWLVWLNHRQQKELRRHYDLAELVHNLYVSIADDEFVAHDIWFLNHQARIFLERGDMQSPFYQAIAFQIEELFKAVPVEMRAELEWTGPVVDYTLARQKFRREVQSE